MKAKLLKKVRKRFEIFHLPKGYVDGGTHYNYNLFKLVDNDVGGWGNLYAQLGKREDGRRYVDEIFNTEVECINYLKSRIIKRLRSEGYKQCKDKSIQTAEKKVWHI
jgi:hypothetical protein